MRHEMSHGETEDKSNDHIQDHPSSLSTLWMFFQNCLQEDSSDERLKQGFSLCYHFSAEIWVSNHEGAAACSLQSKGPSFELPVEVA